MGKPEKPAESGILKNTPIRRIRALDVSKQTFKCCTLTAEKNFEDRTVTSGRMDPEGRMAFARAMKEGDIIILEGGTSTYNFARELMKQGIAEVVVLNPAKLHVIFQSQCKTDKQDSVKLARYIRDTNRENWVTLQIPSEDESALRSIINAYDSAKKERTRNINKLHAIFNQSGFPMLKKSDLARNMNRLACIDAYLEGTAYVLAITVERLISSIEIDIEQYRQMIRDSLMERPRETITWMSIPGIGLMTAASLVAYVGDGSRFYTPAQLRNYIALVPRIDQSGKQCIIGRTSSFGCKPVRKNIIQCALSIENLGSDCGLREMWWKLRDSGKKRQIIGVKIANKMLTIGWTLLKKRELYNGLGDYSRVKRKLRQEGLGAIDCSMFPELS